MKNILPALFLMIAVDAAAQFQYRIDQSIPLEVEGKSLSMPWAGGLNSAQINTMDLNGDNQNDIVIYDKGVDKIWTFVRTQTNYRYAPEFETLFPTDIQSFILLRDYNGDGKKDLFTFNNAINGISAYRNVSNETNKLAWQKFIFINPKSKANTEILLTEGLSFKDSLKNYTSILPGYDDIPNIIDMDGDGDLDILNMRFVNPSEPEYQQNISNSRDTLIFRKHVRWGDWEECECGSIAFGQSCAELAGGRSNATTRTDHTGGKALLTLDVDNDGDQDVLYSEEKCSRLYILPNIGTSETALMNTIATFPSSTPITFSFFPSPFLEDVDFDGVKDLLISPNVNARTAIYTNFKESLWMYKNTGTEQFPNFTFSKNNFLQEEMIDVGDNSVPTFFDYDADGDQDLFIGTFTSADDYTGRIIQYDNVGTVSNPAFKFITDDFAFISYLRLYNVKPQFADMNGDGTFDLAFTASQLVDGTTSLYFLPNKGKEKINITFTEVVDTNFSPGFTENIFLTDVNKDGALDILIGKSTGALQYLENSGPPGSFNFILKNSTYLGLGISTARQNISIAIGDLDADGNEDLITGDQKGTLTIFNNFKSTNPVPVGITDLLYDSLNSTYTSKNLGGRVWPTVTNLFNTNKPAIAVGNTLGGVYILKSDDSHELPDEPVITISPNPLPKGEKLNIRADRNVTMEIFSLLGQRMSEPLFIPANQSYDLPIQNISAGLYIAHFTVAGGKSVGKKFVLQ